MYKRLKECKTLREIYEVLGTDFFTNLATWILCLWCLLPIASAFSHIYQTLNKVTLFSESFSDGLLFSNVLKDYQSYVESLGFLTLELALAYLLGVFLLRKRSLKECFLKEPWHFFLLTMLLWSCISTALSDNPLVSLRGTEYRFDGLESYFFYASVYVCALLAFKGKTFKRIFPLFTGVANVVSLILLLQEWGVSFFEKCFFMPMASVFMQFNHTGYYLCMSILCLAGLYCYSPAKSVRRIYYLFSFGFQVYALLVNSTLGSYLGVCVGLPFFAFIFCRQQGSFRRHVLCPILLLILISTASYFGLVPTSSGQDMSVNIATLVQDGKAILTNSEEAKNAGHGRMTLWQQGLKMIPERPIFGYGPEQLNEKYAEIMWVDRPDNEFIQHAIFLGIPGLLFYLAALISLLVYQLRHIKAAPAFAVIAAGSVTAYLVSSCFGNTMFYTVPYFYLFLGCAAHTEERT